VSEVIDGYDVTDWWMLDISNEEAVEALKEAGILPTEIGCPPNCNRRKGVFALTPCSHTYFHKIEGKVYVHNDWTGKSNFPEEFSPPVVL
jgi:hypothetical protein